MSSLTPRSAWVDPAHPVTGPASNLAAIDRIVIHYPGVNPGALNLNDPVSVLRNTHLYYLHKTPPYSIGYNFATFPSGRFELRGFGIKNAANVNHNDHTLSINVMVNGADEATPMQVQYTRDMVDDIWAHLGRKVPLVAHGDLSGASTACPGAGIRRQLAAGMFLPVEQKPPTVEKPQPPAPQGDDMFLIKQANDDAVYLVIPAPRTAAGRFRSHIIGGSGAGQWPAIDASYGPLTTVADVNAFGPIVGS